MLSTTVARLKFAELFPPKVWIGTCVNWINTSSDIFFPQCIPRVLNALDADPPREPVKMFFVEQIRVQSHQVCVNWHQIAAK